MSGFHASLCRVLRRRAEADVCICTTEHPNYDAQLRESVEHAALCHSVSEWGDRCEREAHEGDEHTAGNGGIRWRDRPPPRSAAIE